MNISKLKETALSIISGDCSSDTELVEYSKKVVQILESGSMFDETGFGALRVAVRNPSCAKLFSKNRPAFEKVIELAGLHKVDSFEHPEATKALLNILYHEPVLRETLLSSDYFSKSLDVLDTSKEIESELFFRLRFIFLCTISSTGARTVLQRPDTLSKLIDTTEEFTGDPITNNANLLELLRILYNVSSDIQSIPDAEHLQNRLFAVVWCYLGMEEHSEATTILKTEAIVTLLNLNEEVLKANPIAEGNIIRLLKGVLEHSGGTSAKINVHATLLAITKLAMVHEPLRKSLRHAILPSKWDRSVKPEEGDSIKAGLIRSLRSNDTNITAASGKLILTLCSNKTYRMVFHVGYGNATGFLFNFDLLGQCQTSQAEFFHEECLPEEASSDEEMMFNGNLEGINPVTGQAQVVGSGPLGTDMTEEEKEAEFTRLADLFEKLEKTGVMKIIPK